MGVLRDGHDPFIADGDGLVDRTILGHRVNSGCTDQQVRQARSRRRRGRKQVLVHHPLPPCKVSCGLQVSRYSNPFILIPILMHTLSSRQVFNHRRYPSRNVTLYSSSQEGVRARTEQNGDQKKMPQSNGSVPLSQSKLRYQQKGVSYIMEIAGCISKIPVLVRRCICWSLGSSNADDMKDAVL